MSLKIISQRGKKVKCTCDVCGVSSDDIVSMIYNESDVLNNEATCRMCNFLTTVDTSRTKMWEQYIKNEVNNSCKYVRNGLYSLSTKGDGITDDFIKGYKLDGYYGDGRLAGVLAKCKGLNSYGHPMFYETDFKYAMRCKYCKQITFADKPDGFECNICKDARLKRKVALYTSAKRKSSGKDFLSFKPDFEPKEGSTLQKNIQKIETNNSGYKFISFGQDNKSAYVVACKDCGNVEILNKPTDKLKTCKMCLSGTNNLGVLKMSYIGVTKFGLTCVAQDKENFTCTLQCNTCNKELSGKSLYNFLYGNYYCNCGEGDKIISGVTCDECYKDIDYNYNFMDYMKGKDFICPDCGKSLNDLVDEAVVIWDTSTSFRKKLSMANAVMKSNTVFTSTNKEPNPDLKTERDSFYSGNGSGKYYKRCYCQKHDIGLILTEEEILNYNHQYCSDSRQCVVADLDFKNVNLGG